MSRPGITPAFGWGCEDNVRKFKIEPEIQIGFVPKEEQGDATINNIGTKEGVPSWNNSVTSIIWHVRWTQKGLQAIKPCVHLKGGLLLGPGRACKLA